MKEFPNICQVIEQYSEITAAVIKVKDVSDAVERKKYCAALFLDLLLWTGWFHYIIHPLKLTLKTCPSWNFSYFFFSLWGKTFCNPFIYFFDHNNLFFLLVHPVSSKRGLIIYFFNFIFYNCAFHFVTGSRHHAHPSSLLLLSGHLCLRLPHWSFFRKKWIKKKYF